MREISETECVTRSRRLGGVGGGGLVKVLKERKRYSDGRYKNVVTVASPTKVVVPRTNANSSRSARVNTSRPTTKTGQIRYRKHIPRYG